MDRFTKRYRNFESLYPDWDIGMNRKMISMVSSMFRMDFYGFDGWNPRYLKKESSWLRKQALKKEKYHEVIAGLDEIKKDKKKVTWPRARSLR